MKKDITLVILAGGMGSRFGGLKQIEPIGPNGEFIIDYSIYDAIKVGFTKVVFLIKKDIFEVFKETVGKRVESHIKTEYVFQEFDSIPLNIKIPSDRVKPLGTAHAILCARNLVKEPFAIINADDFYGRDAFVKAYDYLSNIDVTSNNYGMIGYKVANTLTENGSVKRGVCLVDNNDYLVSISESKVDKVNNIIIAAPLNGDNQFIVREDDTVSMNFFLFTPTIFKYLEDEFSIFMEANKNNLLTSEYLIPNVVTSLVKNGVANTKVIRTTSVWYGVTYREDTPDVKVAINSLVWNGIYHYNLWD